MLRWVCQLSHSKTVVLVMILLVFTFGRVEFIFGSPRTVPVRLLQDEVHHKQWETFLDSLQVHGEVPESMFMWFAKEMRTLVATPRVMDQVIEYLQTTRQKMPMEFRWVLAAAEIERKKITNTTGHDAMSALENIRIFQNFVIPVGTVMSLRIEYVIKKPNSGQTQVLSSYFQSLEDLLFIYGNIQQAPEFKPDFFVNPQIDDLRINWLSHLQVIAKQVSGREIFKALMKFVNPNSRRFSSREKKRQFLVQTIGLVSDYGFRFGDKASLSSYGEPEFQLSKENKIIFSELQQLVRSWLLEDLVFASIHFDTYLRRGYISIDDFLSVAMSDEKKMQVEKVLKKDEKVEFASYVINALLWIKNYANDGSQVAEQATLKLAKILFGAQLGTNSAVRLQSGLFSDSERIYPTDYLRYLDAFYQVTGAIRNMSRKVVNLAMNVRHLRFEFMSDQEWEQIEIRRFKFIQNNSSASDFNAYIRKIFLEDSPAYGFKDRLFVAKVFREIGNPIVAQEMANELKIKTRSRFYFSKASAMRAAWNKNEGALAHLVFAMNPQDSELKSYLVDLYVNHSTDGAVATSGQNALRMLEVIGTEDLSVRDEILRSLKFMGAGDSAGSLSALLRLFPDQSSQVVEILFQHSREKEKKLAAMLLVLRERAVENPAIVHKIREAVREKRNTPEGSSRVYQGLRLDEWLERHVAYLLKLKEVKFCAALWREI